MSFRRPPAATLAALPVGLALLVAACGGGAATRPPSTTARPTPQAVASGAASAAASRDPGQTDASSAAPSREPGSTDASSAPTGPWDPAGVAVSLDPVVDIPGAPLAIADPGDGSGRLFVTERGGRVWAVRDGQRAENPFLDIATRTAAGGESGLLGLAFHPDFPTDPRFFIYYTNLDRDQVVAERRVDGADPERADRDHERPLLVMDDFAGNHNGGALAFGPDGFLYIATGDGGGGGDPQGTGQRLDTPLGKILRIGVDPEGDRPYSIPPDNPFVGNEGAAGEIWHLGLRNPWRFSFDRETGDLWIGDVGQNTWEEVDVARDGRGGLNYGWSVTEGPDCFREQGCSTEGITQPVAFYGRDAGCTVIGGVVYRGAEWPALRGAYLFADYCSGTVWAIDAAEDRTEQPTVVAQTGRSISSFGEDAAGEVYATDLAGQLLRLSVAAQ
jgi:glucose/arabinose dehydrogenase